MEKLFVQSSVSPVFGTEKFANVKTHYRKLQPNRPKIHFKLVTVGPMSQFWAKLFLLLR